MERNNLVTTIPVLRKTFQISFSIILFPFPFSFPFKDTWRNIVHFTTGTDNIRLPAIFLGNPKHKKCIIWFESIQFPCYNVLKHGRRLNIDISQQLLNKKARRQFDIIIFEILIQIYSQDYFPLQLCLTNISFIFYFPSPTRRKVPKLKFKQDML